VNVEVSRLLQIIGSLTVENALLREQMEEPAEEEHERRPLSEIEIEKIKQVANSD
jgi:hypothetical protein